MPEPTLQVAASRRLLQEVCAVLAPFRDDAVLIGGWVPEILFPSAFPGHVGSIDVDFAMRASRTRHQQIIEVLASHGFRPGSESYVGYDEGGQLTEAVRRNPYSVVLFDEMEKAHPDVFNVLLQVLDDGRLTDSQGRTVDFKNTVIIMTSNIGSRHLIEGVEGSEIKESTREAVMADLRQHFRPEFLKRVDETVLFKPLGREEIEKIVRLLLADLNKRLAEKRVTVDLDNKAKQWVAEKGYDPVFGARPLIGGEVGEGEALMFTAQNDELKTA